MKLAKLVRIDKTNKYFRRMKYFYLHRFRDKHWCSRITLSKLEICKL